jgi:hypothetical protein
MYGAFNFGYQFLFFGLTIVIFMKSMLSNIIIKKIKSLSNLKDPWVYL